MKNVTNLAVLIESFFLERLLSQRNASQNTIMSYRDTFRLLFQFIRERSGKTPSMLLLEDLSAQCIVDFLGDIEKNRSCSARSRNQRLTAIRSFFHYVSFKVPEKSAFIQQVLTIPKKRYEKSLVDFLNENEIEALLAVPDQKTWIGRRDHLLLWTAIHTGLRLAEIIGLKWADVSLGHGAHVRVIGKGRKERAIPLGKRLASTLGLWSESGNAVPDAPVFPAQHGTKMSPDAFQRMLSKYVRAATVSCPSLKQKRVSPHVLRHSTAMRLLQSGVGQPIIALWLGHESVETTQVYLSADLKMKQKVLAKTAPLKTRYERYRPGDRLLAFLQGL